MISVFVENEEDLSVFEFFSSPSLPHFRSPSLPVVLRSASRWQSRFCAHPRAKVHGNGEESRQVVRRVQYSDRRETESYVDDVFRPGYQRDEQNRDTRIALQVTISSPPATTNHFLLFLYDERKNNVGGDQLSERAFYG